MKQIAFIGAGRMARAIVGGLLKTGAVSADNISCLGANDGTAEQLSADFGVKRCESMATLLSEAQTIVLACKPQQLDSVDASAAEGSRGKTMISILAGTPLARLRKVFPDAAYRIRAMPNTPGLVGAGVTAFAVEEKLPADVEETVKTLLGALGKVVLVDESQLDAVTGLSGSGPAYLFEFVAGLRDAGIAAGLPSDVAYELAVETAYGAAKLLKEVPETPETHRNWVSSPGGTTLAGLAVMEAAGFRSILKDTVLRATERSRELGK